MSCLWACVKGGRRELGEPAEAPVLLTLLWVTVVLIVTVLWAVLHHLGPEDLARTQETWRGN